MHGDTVLKIEDLSLAFKSGKETLYAVDGVSLEIARGEIFGLVGESGCGKTTLGRTVMKIYDCTSGNVYLKGKRICAGTLSYRKKIDGVRKELSGECKKIRSDPTLTMAQKKDLIRIKKAGAAGRISALKQQIRAAQTDNRGRCNRGIQMIFQDPIASLNPRMTVGEIIAEGLIVNGEKNADRIRNEVREMLLSVGLLPEHAGRYPHEFSGGQRQRIGIARALIMKPDIIIADEPVSALDVSVQAQIINLLSDLRKKLGLTVLFIAHDLSVVKYFSDRIGVMYKGKIVEIASSDELFANPLHPYTRSLLSAIPLPDPYAKARRSRTLYEGRATSEGDPTLNMREVSDGHFLYCTNTEQALWTGTAPKEDQNDF